MHQNMASKIGINFLPREKNDANFWCHPAEQNTVNFTKKSQITFHDSTAIASKATYCHGKLNHNQTFSRYFQNVSMCRYRYFLSNVSMYRYNTVSIHFKSIWYRYFFNQFLGLISVFIAFLCDNFCRNSKVTIMMFKNNVKRFLKCEILSNTENFHFWFDKNLNFLEYFGQKGVK